MPFPAVRTVRGDIDPQQLGVVYCHEHLLTAPKGREHEGDPDLRLDDEDKAAAELQTFKAAGGGTIVEVTTPEFGRAPGGLRRLSERTGVHIVAATGHVSEDYWRGVLDLDAASEPDLVEALTSEVLTGMCRSDVRAGIIKVGSSRESVTPTEAKIMRAAAVAQQQTGAPITTHTTAGTAGLEQVKILERAGADLERVCIGHLDRRLVWSEHLSLAREGVFLGYDCVSKNQYEPDERRVDFIVRLVAAGHGHQICLSGDLARRRYLVAWGGRPGYRYILERFVPQLRGAGLSTEAVGALLGENPRRLLTMTRAA